MPHRIVIVEDSAALNELLCNALRKEGYEVSGFLDAESLLEYPNLKDTDLMVLDIQLPGESGLSLAKRFREFMPALGIMMLTTRTSNGQRIEGYDAGADFYLPKPISPAELCQAVNSLLARRNGGSALQTDLQQPVCYLTRASHVLSCGEQNLKLSAAEVAILTALAGAPDKQLEHWQLLELLSSEAEVVNRAALDVRIYRLRGKLKETVNIDQPIVSVRGFGYRLGFELRMV